MVTVLFADLSGFTRLSEQLDPEVVQSLQNELFEELTEAVEAFGGFVDKFIGDALLVLFGAPVAHENDPERALGAALDMIRRTAEVDRRWQGRLGQSLTLHVGVNTGQVVAGGFGAGSARSYSVTGDTVNTAQRLQSLAKSSEILVGPATVRLARHAFAFESLGDVSLRGKAGSVLVHRLVGPLEERRTARGLEAFGLRTPLIGREAEIGRLLASLEQACNGTAQLVRLVAEAGVGKSRLVNEFIARIGEDSRSQNVAVRLTTCSPLGGESYATLGSVLRSASGMLPNEPPARTREKLAALLDELGLDGEEAGRLTPLLYHVLGLGDPAGALRHVEAEQLHRQILYAVRVIIERRLALSPLLIVVEDVHWADAVSLEALRFVMDRLERSRLMLLITERPDAERDRLLSSRFSHTTLRLRPFKAEEGGMLLDALFGAAWAGVEAVGLRDRILYRAGGNPLFIEEIVRGLVEVGVLERTNDGWRVHHRAEIDEIPATIQAMLLARVDRLPPEGRRLAQEAAVVGPTFEASLIRAIAADPTGLETGIEALCDAGIIEEVAGGASLSSRCYRFTQLLLQDTIYQNLLLQRRAELHLRIGSALEKRHGAQPERLEDITSLGHHFSRSTMREKGAGYLMAAGDRAREIYANEDAVRFYEQALAAIESSERSPLALQLAERIADLCSTSGRRDLAQRHYGAALSAYRSANDDQSVARLLRKQGRLLWNAGLRAAAEASYAEAAATLTGVDAPVEQAQLLQERARLAFRLGDHDSAMKWAEEALDQVARLPSDARPEERREAAHAAAEALNTKGIALARLGRNFDAVREVERSVEAARSAELCSATCRGYTNLSVLYTIVDPKRAIDVCKEGLEVACRIGDLGFQARLLANLAVASCTFTDRCGTEGVPAAKRAIEIDRDLDQREHLAVPLIVLGQIHQCHSEPELAERSYTEALTVALETGEPQQLFPCYDGLATLCLDRDDLAAADRYFSLARDVCARNGLNPETLVVLPFLD